MPKKYSLETNHRLIWDLNQLDDLAWYNMVDNRTPCVIGKVTIDYDYIYNVIDYDYITTGNCNYLR